MSSSHQASGRGNTATTKFSLFSQLPKELQTIVWEYAHAETAVWVVICHQPDQDGEGPPAVVILENGPAKSMVSLACRDAEQAFKPLRRRIYSSGERVWVDPLQSHDMRSKIVYISDIRDAEVFIENTNPAFLATIKHIALAPGCYTHIERAMSAIQRKCPGLETLTASWVAAGTNTDITSLQGRNLWWNEIDQLASLSRRPGPEYMSPGFTVGPGPLGVRHWKSLYRHFHEGWPPKLHVLGPVTL